MELVIASDSSSTLLKSEVISYLLHAGHQMKDISHNFEKNDDDFEIVRSLCLAIQSGEFKQGILLSKSGIPFGIYANKFRGIRCAVCTEPHSAKVAKEEINANIISLGSEISGLATAKSIIDAWLYTSFIRANFSTQVEDIARIENQNLTDFPIQEFSKVPSFVSATNPAPTSISAAKTEVAISKQEAPLESLQPKTPLSPIQKMFAEISLKKNKTVSIPEEAENHLASEEKVQASVPITSPSEILPENKSDSKAKGKSKLSEEYTNSADNSPKIGANPQETLAPPQADSVPLEQTPNIPPRFLIDEDLPSMEETASAFKEMQQQKEIPRANTEIPTPPVKKQNFDSTTEFLEKMAKELSKKASPPTPNPPTL